MALIKSRGGKGAVSAGTQRGGPTQNQRAQQGDNGHGEPAGAVGGGLGRGRTPGIGFVWGAHDLLG